MTNDRPQGPLSTLDCAWLDTALWLAEARLRWQATNQTPPPLSNTVPQLGLSHTAHFIISVNNNRVTIA